MLEKLKESLATCPVVKFGDYQYFVHPITDGIPEGDPEVLEEVVDAIVKTMNLDCDKIVTAESMGFPLASALSLRTGIPYVFIRKRKYDLPGEISLVQTTGYSGSDMFINFINRGDRVVFVDDVLSTGGTLKAIIIALRQMGAEIVDVLTVFEKVGKREELERELDIEIKTLLPVEVVDGKVVIR
ncbi:MAG: purine phosphoribosyltransferase family protein [Methanobacteriota archaeon]|nr:MAG: purine phosphoribosyltransferase family protein [Euryarchaeota archaeon]